MDILDISPTTIILTWVMLILFSLVLISIGVYPPMQIIPMCITYTVLIIFLIPMAADQKKV